MAKHISTLIETGLVPRFTRFFFFFFIKTKIFNRILRLRQQIWLITYHISTITLLKMQKSLKYTIFKTKWGHFGLVGTEYALYRTCLPGHGPERTRRELLKSLPIVSQKSSIEYRASRIENDNNLFRPLQEQIAAYFEGAYVDFSQGVPIVLNGFSPFGSSVLCACRSIRFGQVVTYSALAQKIGRHAAVRAVGSALAKNPLPLIIPCHRVVCSDGKIGGFSAAGGKNLKAKLLKHEKGIESQIKRGAKFQNI